MPAGAAVGVATGFAHPTWWGLGLGWAATLAALWWCPAGWRRSGYAAGWLAALVGLATPRPEGDLVVLSAPSGYAYLLLGLLVLAGTIATLPRPR